MHEDYRNNKLLIWHIKNCLRKPWQNIPHGKDMIRELKYSFYLISKDVVI